MSPFEPTPRWPGAPPICLKTNLPAFATPADLNSFHDANGPGTHVMSKWRCDFCGYWHYWAKAPSPAGESSGSAREYRPPKYVLEWAAEVA